MYNAMHPRMVQYWQAQTVTFPPLLPVLELLAHPICHEGARHFFSVAQRFELYTLQGVWLECSHSSLLIVPFASAYTPKLVTCVPY